MVGIGRGKAMPGRKFVKQQHMYLPTSIFFQTITGAYAEAQYPQCLGRKRSGLHARISSTARAVPWTSDVTIQVICDVYKQDGRRARWRRATS